MRDEIIEKIRSNEALAGSIAGSLGGMSVLNSPYATLKNEARSIYSAAVAQVALNAANSAVEDIFKDIEND